MENKHTLGTRTRGLLTSSDDDHCVEVVAESGELVADFYFMLAGDMAEAKANAKLFIAAPDLLEAAKLMIAGAESEGWDRARGTDEPRTGIAELRRAIEKAEGVA